MAMVCEFSKSLSQPRGVASSRVRRGDLGCSKDSCARGMRRGSHIKNDVLLLSFMAFMRDCKCPGAGGDAAERGHFRARDVRQISCLVCRG
jgi:hypothetical protein